MKDLQSAEITFNHFCDRSAAPPKQVAAALTQLADWHLKIAQDVDSARSNTGKNHRAIPGNTAGRAVGATHRASGRHGENPLAAHDRQAVAVPEGVQNIGLLDSTEFLRPRETDPGTLAAEY